MKQFYTLLLTLVSAVAFCQYSGISLSPNGSAPDPSAILDMNTTQKGMLMPRMTQAQRDSINSPAFGLLVLNTTTGCINLWLGVTWKQICGDCDFSNPVPGNNGPICEGQTLSLTATDIPGATYHWTTNGFNQTTQNPFILNATPNASGPYSVQATLNGCTSQAQTTVATVSSIPQTPVAGNNGPCIDHTLILTSSSIIGATYNWTGPNGWTGNTQNPIIGDVQPGQAGIYIVTASVSGCSSAPDSTTVVVHTIPSMPSSISGSALGCGNSSGNVYSVPPVAGATTYNWSVPPGASITAGQGTNSITVTYGNAPGNISVTAGNSCGTSFANTLSIDMITTPKTFTYTGGMETFIVPSCASTITISAYGAQGGSQYGNGALGGSATGTLSVTPGDTLYVFVGGQNGYNGGGAGGLNCTGGGMSDVRKGGTAFSNWVIVAGGGGGGGSNGIGYLNTTTGTGGGGNACSNGAGGGGGGYYNGYSYSSAGGPGTCTNGGASGNSYGGWAGGGGGGGLTSGGSGGVTGGFGNPGSDGTQGHGGDYGYNSACGGSSVGAGGGGGYYGGGGAASGQCASGSGGGGSSWASPSMTNLSFNPGVQSGNGQVVISW